MAKVLTRSPVARAGPLDDTAPDPAHSPERLAAGREELARALAALDELPPRQRDVLYLSACEGLPTAAVAAVLGISPAAAKASLSLARQKLRQLLAEEAPVAGEAGRPGAEEGGVSGGVR